MRLIKYLSAFLILLCFSLTRINAAAEQISSPADECNYNEGCDPDLDYSSDGNPDNQSSPLILQSVSLAAIAAGNIIIPLSPIDENNQLNTNVVSWGIMISNTLGLSTGIISAIYYDDKITTWTNIAAGAVLAGISCALIEKKPDSLAEGIPTAEYHRKLFSSTNMLVQGTMLLSSGLISLLYTGTDRVGCRICEINKKSWIIDIYAITLNIAGAVLMPLSVAKNYDEDLDILDKSYLFRHMFTSGAGYFTASIPLMIFSQFYSLTPYVAWTNVALGAIELIMGTGLYSHSFSMFKYGGAAFIPGGLLLVATGIIAGLTYRDRRNDSRHAAIGKFLENFAASIGPTTDGAAIVSSLRF